MEQTENKTFGLYSILAFLLGLSICEGITAVLSIGSTVFTFSEVLSPFIFICILISRQKEFFAFLKNIPIGFKVFFIFIIFSAIPSLILYGFDSIYRYIVGFVYLLIVFTTAADVFILRKEKAYLLKGIIFGLGLNLLFSLVCYIAFNAGTVISLEGFTGRDEFGFYVPTMTFRTQGFFLEPSHFVRFVASIFLIVAAYRAEGSSWFKLFWAAISIFVLLYSFSGSIVIFAFGIVAYLLIRKKRINRYVKPTSLLIAVIVVILCVVLAANQEFTSNIGDIISKICTGADITDKGNAARYDSMKIVLEHLDIALFGCGWNQFGTFIETDNLGIVSAFSDLLEMTIEIGFFGILIYIISIFSLAIKLIKIKTEKSVAIAISILMIFALQIGTDYAFNTCIMFVFGMAVCEFAEYRERKLLQ